MPAIDAVIVAAIVAAFLAFAGGLAWVEHQASDFRARRSAENVPGR